MTAICLPTERSFLIDLFLFLRAFADDVGRAAFAFVIDAADVFAEDAHEGELDAADEEDEGDEGRIAWDVFAEEQCAQDDEDEIDGGDDGQETAGKGGDAQRRRREAGNAVDGQVEELPVVPLGLARSPGRPVKEDFFLLEANPAEQALGIALTFAQAAQGLDAAPVEQAEVADVFLDRDGGTIS